MKEDLRRAIQREAEEAREVIRGGNEEWIAQSEVGVFGRRS